jgi:hypothetical protein
VLDVRVEYDFTLLTPIIGDIFGLVRMVPASAWSTSRSCA